MSLIVFARPHWQTEFLLAILSIRVPVFLNVDLLNCQVECQLFFTWAQLLLHYDLESDSLVQNSWKKISGFR